MSRIIACGYRGSGFLIPASMSETTARRLTLVHDAARRTHHASATASSQSSVSPGSEPPQSGVLRGPFQKPRADVETLSEVSALPEDIPLEKLYARFAPYAAAIASRILGREGEVEDVVQDVFAAAVTGLRTRNNVHEIRGWLAKVTVRTSMRKLRARRFWRFFDLDETPHYEKLADPAAGPYEQQLISELYRALDGLKAEDRVAWVLRYVEGQELKEAAELCHCSLATLKRRVARAHAAVGTRLSGSHVPRVIWEARYVP